MPRRFRGVPSRTRGFTLLELLVVMVIISIVASIAVLSLGSLGEDPPGKQAAERLAALTDLAAQQAVMQGEQIGLLVSPHEYQFLLYDGSRWSLMQDDTLLHSRSLGNEVTLTLHLDGATVDLPGADQNNSESDGSDQQQRKPQIMLLSSGELTPFEIVVSGSDPQHPYRVQGSLLHGIELIPPGAAPE